MPQTQVLVHQTSLEVGREDHSPACIACLIIHLLVMYYGHASRDYATFTRLYDRTSMAKQVKRFRLH